MGWDHRSLLLMLRSTKSDPEGEWKRFRLPKASHCYDGAHGWNTEWPRIREVGEPDLLMTMHGTFWRFPSSFDVGKTLGITPRSAYLKVVGDFCRFEDKIVLGCDDAAKSEFLNRRKAKGKIAGPAESQSNLWFLSPDQLDQLGPNLGRGGVFVNEEVQVGTWSDPFLFEGYHHRAIHLAHDADAAVQFRFEVDQGDGQWQPLMTVKVGSEGYRFFAFPPEARGAWVRVAVDRTTRATAWFEYRNRDTRAAQPKSDFKSLAPTKARSIGGLLRAGNRTQGLQVLAAKIDGNSESMGYYELRPDLSLIRIDSPKDDAGNEWMQKHVAIPTGVVRKDGSSILYIDDQGQTWRLPIGNPDYATNPTLLDLQRTAREIVTERDLFQCAGTFFELPALNAGGFAKVRPIATHPYFIQDFCSWRGLLALTGLRIAKEQDPRVIRSEDKQCALWLGTIDDLWGLGKPRGTGGPWFNSKVRAGVPSDPYLMAGYDHKSLTLSHKAPSSIQFFIEVDITGTGQWHRFKALQVPPASRQSFKFPDSFAAYWVRLVTDRDCEATAHFEYR